MTLPTAAIYLAKSTGSQGQAELRELLAARGYLDPLLFEDVEGTLRRRPALGKLLAEAKAGNVEVVVVSSLDQFGGGFNSLRVVDELAEHGARLLSASEPWVAEAGPALLAALAGWVDQVERRRHLRKTCLGLATAIKKGVKLGRPRLPLRQLQAAAAAVAEGASKRGAARALGISEAALRAYLKTQAGPLTVSTCACI